MGWIRLCCDRDTGLDFIRKLRRGSSIKLQDWDIQISQSVGPLCEFVCCGYIYKCGWFEDICNMYWESVLKLQVLRFLSCVIEDFDLPCHWLSDFFMFWRNGSHLQSAAGSSCETNLLKWRWLCLLFCLWCKEIAAVLPLQNWWSL